MAADLDALVEAAAVHGQLAAGADPAVVAARTNNKRLVVVAARGNERGRSLKWTESEDDYLRRNLGRLSEEEMGRVLGRTALAVRLRWKRDLHLTPPSKAPDILTGNQVANGLGIDSHTIIKLMDRGIIPARFLPFTCEGRMVRQVRVIDRLTLLRWVVNPLHWIYFKFENIGRGTAARGAHKYIADRVFWQRVRDLVQRRRELWNDAWWTPSQVEDWHGNARGMANQAIHDGRLPAVRWGNWWVLRSDATRPGFQLTAWHGKGGAGQSRVIPTPAAQAFVVLAAAAGLTAASIGPMMHAPAKSVDFWLRKTRRAGRLPWIVRTHHLPVRFNHAGDMLADWKELRRRFPRAARAMDRLRRRERLSPRELLIVRGVLQAWAQFHARTPDQRAIAVSLRTLGRRQACHFHDLLGVLRRAGMDPFRRLA